MKKTQEDFVVDYLLKNRQISRNFCLQNYITRLGARISDLNKDGWEIEGKFVKTEHGKDYIYSVIRAPYEQVEYKVEGVVVGSVYNRVI